MLCLVFIGEMRAVCQPKNTAVGISNAVQRAHSSLIVQNLIYQIAGVTWITHVKPDIMNTLITGNFFAD